MTRPLIIVMALAACLVVWPSSVCAQAVAVNEPGPVGPFVVDIRGAFARFGSDAQLAASRNIPSEQLPSAGPGLELGAHVYPLRWGAVTFGLGVSWVAARAATHPDLEKVPTAVEMVTRFTALNPQLSFNFGNKRGWSYISGGILTSVLSVDREGEDRRPSPGLKTINYGGGARWFARPHVAFSVDVRFYAVNPSLPTADYPGNPRATFTVFSAGISLQ